MPSSDVRKQVEAWEAERDEIVGQDFTPERSRRVEELDRLIDQAWADLAATGQPDPLRAIPGGDDDVR